MAFESDSEGPCDCYNYYKRCNELLESYKDRPGHPGLISQISKTRHCVECGHTQRGILVHKCGHVRFSKHQILVCIGGFCGGRRYPRAREEEASRSEHREMEYTSQSESSEPQSEISGSVTPSIEKGVTTVVRLKKEQVSKPEQRLKRKRKTRKRSGFVKGDLDLETEEWFERKGGSRSQDFAH